jgi:hypothetical protein
MNSSETARLLNTRGSSAASGEPVKSPRSPCGAEGKTTVGGDIGQSEDLDV